jgi:hypothetical protein
VTTSLPRGVFARLAFVAVATADRNAHADSFRPFLSDAAALALGAEALRAAEDAERLGATPAHWVAFGRWLRDEPCKRGDP